MDGNNVTRHIRRMPKTNPLQKNKKNCENYTTQKTCEYQYIFETSPKLFKQPLITRKLQGVTKPYTLESIQLQENRNFIFHLNLTGKRAISSEPFIIYGSSGESER